MPRYVYELSVSDSPDFYSVDEHDNYTCDSMETAMNLAETEYVTPEQPLIWTTAYDPEVFQTGSYTDSEGHKREVKISRRTVRTPKTLKYDGSRIREYKVRSRARRELLGWIRRAPYVGGTPHVWSNQCMIKDCDYAKSNKHWGATQAQKALVEHHKAKHGLKEG